MNKSPLMKKVLNLFKKTHETNDESPPYPADLERTYRISKRVLGVGSFAVVKECFHKQTGQPFALKIILKKAIAGKEHMLSSELDHQSHILFLDILKQVRHPNVVSMHGLYESKDAVYIVTDLAGGGELFTQLLAKGNYTEKDASAMVKQILEGVEYLHNLDIVHRDLKPENLLFQTPDEHANLMITDFGLSKILKNHDDILTTACGTPGYVAPEVLLQTGHGKPVDLWSLGVITFTLLSGYTPFWGEANGLLCHAVDQAALFESIMSGKYEYDEEYWSDISDAAKDLIDKMLTFNPSKRITASQALKHPWITNEQNAVARDEPNLIGNVRKGFNSKHSLQTIVTAISVLNHWKNLEDDSDVEEKEPQSKRDSHLHVANP
ncbi:hypothetical protein INT44_008783 [Umbelopsis vinacea]|uniref:Protein kinase domain-containing protein n=1 Tax=Umbelopsis vinacea TaxID=44442 RepID=A0A8H7PHN5_9FUNG|nr:hypothetical protein INT44_008783 [Umbelopsis vinacea]